MDILACINRLCGIELLNIEYCDCKLRLVCIISGSVMITDSPVINSFSFIKSPDISASNFQTTSLASFAASPGVFLAELVLL